jgi:RNase P subunit RPR2
MLFQVMYCPACKTKLKYAKLIRRYTNKDSAVLPKEFCPKCGTIELSGKDVDFFIFGEEFPKPIGIARIKK